MTLYRNVYVTYDELNKRMNVVNVRSLIVG